MKIDLKILNSEIQIYKTYLLTKPQQSIWNMEQYYGGSVANITGSVMFGQSVNIQKLQKALNGIVERYDSLRIHLEIQNGMPMQCIGIFKSNIFEIIKFSKKDDFDLWIKSFAQTPFDISGNLFKFIIITVGQQIGFACKLHHLIADAWTLHLLINAIMQTLNGETPDAYSYLGYLETEKEYDISARREKDKDYFLNCFKKCSEPVFIGNNQAGNPDADHLAIVISKSNVIRIKEFCDENSISPYSLFMTALAIYMYRIKGEQNLYIGTAILNRSGKKEKATAGMFVNTIPVLFHIDELKNTLQNLKDNAENLSGVFRHQKYQYGDLLNDIREQYGFKERIFDVVLSYQNAVLESGMKAQFYFSGQQVESLNIHINDRHQDGVFNLDYTYQTELFTQHDIERLHEHWLNLVTDIIDNCGKNPPDLKMLSDDEYQKVVYDFNDTAVDYPKDKCIHQLFEEQAARTPEAVAIIFEDVSYTYKQINEMANSLAHILREKGVGRDDIIAIIAKRSYKIIVAQLAVLKAGGAYMPIDLNYPEDRIDFMLNDAKCKIVLELGVAFEGGIDMANDEIFKGNTANPEHINSSSDLCYVIFTSGSTGTAKGVMITHSNFANFCNNNNKNSLQVMIAEKCKSFFCLGAFVFDMASAEVYLALLNNHTVVLPNESQLESPDEIARLAKKNKVDFILTTPTRALSYLHNASFAMAIKTLKILSLGGEVLTQDAVKTLKYHTDAIILNGYGPAETTQGCTWTMVDGDITIGKPIANMQIYILDKQKNPLPVNAIGELYVSGDGVGRGYLNRPELTAEKFTPSPFIKGKHMYQTGDLARWRDDGNIEYIGRIDNQIKIRGLRVELGEIEAAMVKFDGIKQAVVVDKKDERGQQYICAYYISDSDIDIDIKALRIMLARTLPRYMIPHFLTRLEGFPATPSGKIDRKAFPAPDFTQSQSNADYVAPKTEQERIFVRLFEDVLGVSPIGMNDSFFDLGGDSLKVIEFTGKAQSEGFAFSVQDVFDYPTPSALINHISEKSCNTKRYQNKDFIEIHKMLSNNKSNSKPLTAAQPLGNVLITGATGWLGAHVLNEFLITESGNAFCLVRGKNLSDSQNKLNKKLANYFGEKYMNCDRIIPVCGDITNRIILEQQIDTIVHCAANVKHYGNYDTSHAVNVTGTENIIALAKEKDAKLFHISTTSVSGNRFEQPQNSPPTIFDETKLYIGQPLENVYLRSKFEAETAILKAKLGGLDATVVRVGNLSNRYSDSMFQDNYRENATLARLRGFITLKMYPESMQNFPLEFSPVDDTAKAILTIARNFERGHSVFHAYNSKTVCFADFARVLAETGIEMIAVPAERFMAAVQNTPNIREVFIHDIGIDGNLNLKSNIELNNDFTAQCLNLAGFEWNLIDDRYLKNYICYFMNNGYWEEAK